MQDPLNVAPGGVRRLRVLVVEDEAVTAMHVEDMVAALGHVVVDVVASGPAAVAAVARTPADLVLMDISLAGGTDGIAAALEIRRADSAAAVVFMTAHTDPGTRRRAEPAGALGWLSKPFGMEQLAALLEQAAAQAL